MAGRVEAVERVPMRRSARRHESGSPRCYEDRDLEAHLSPLSSRSECERPRVADALERMVNCVPVANRL